MSDTTDNSLRVTVEFSGGAELLFDNQRKKQLILPINGNNNAWNLRQLIDWLKVNHLKERPELFVSDSGNGVTVRPGILVLVNDVDWELLGETDYQINNNDSILFISTLHGG